MKKISNSKFFGLALVFSMLALAVVVQVFDINNNKSKLVENKIVEFFPQRDNNPGILEFFAYNSELNKFGFDCYADDGKTRLTFEFETANLADLKLLDCPDFPQKTFTHWRLMTIYALEHDTDGVRRNPIYFRDLPYKQKEFAWAVGIFNDRLDSVLKKNKANR